MYITKFAIPEVIFGRGSIKYLAQCVLRLGGKRILLVSDPGLERAGWADLVIDLFETAGLDCVYFSDVNSNPRDRQVHEGAELYKEFGADVIVGLGGGSPIDAAKGIATLVGNGGRIRDFEGANKIMRPLPPMVFIPTTAGSGSDVTQYCIITDMERQVKMSIISRSLVPNISIIDPNLLRTKTPDLIMASAIDALAHAIESYVSLLASPFSEPQALMAITLIMDNLKTAAETRDPDALEQLSIASTSAGMSFSNAGLGVGHSLAHSMGGRYDVLHGLIHPALLPSVMHFNMQNAPRKMAVIGRRILGGAVGPEETQAERGIEKLRQLFRSLGVVTRLRDLLPGDPDLKAICDMALLDACTLTNPRQVGREDLMGICKAAW